MQACPGLAVSLIFFCASDGKAEITLEANFHRALNANSRELAATEIMNVNYRSILTLISESTVNGDSSNHEYRER